MGTLPGEQQEQITILDMEASIEHLTRGTVRNVDALLVVAEPYYRALETAGRMAPLARELGLERVYVVANKVRGDRDEAAIQEYCRRHDLDLLSLIPFDERVAEADIRGRAVLDDAPDAPAVAAIGTLAERVLERLQAPAPVAAEGGDQSGRGSCPWVP